jgi:hypothetical protein
MIELYKIDKNGGNNGKNNCYLYEDKKSFERSWTNLTSYKGQKISLFEDVVGYKLEIQNNQLVWVEIKRKKKNI